MKKCHICRFMAAVGKRNPEGFCSMFMEFQKHLLGESGYFLVERVYGSENLTPRVTKLVELMRVLEQEHDIVLYGYSNNGLGEITVMDMIAAITYALEVVTPSEDIPF